MKWSLLGKAIIATVLSGVGMFVGTWLLLVIVLFITWYAPNLWHLIGIWYGPMILAILCIVILVSSIRTNYRKHLHREILRKLARDRIINK